ncbi:helix-turn-helix domain-containing protein [Chitinophaga niabensis]|uniref:DNA-binding transcriptional regulator, XRE-family HTH domain n=1 Tax=Chitinophaga niabensis TaxID=536979 RepID=A0A1N6KAQ5_9BACT|nr:helix-turn-helix transcriptional regulator [Chitinophaga niabensis]SIO53553.1 DNA-binding transcriptional regulator, XRE-family HTH domain [Chitinophaga niabensis]
MTIMESSRYIVELINFGNNVRTKRTALGMTQDDLSFHTNIERSEISRIENGKRNIEFETIVRLAEALGTSTSELFLPEKDENSLI